MGISQRYKNDTTDINLCFMKMPIRVGNGEFEVIRRQGFACNLNFDQNFELEFTLN